MTAPKIVIIVRGEPAGQGNLRTGRHGKAYHANSAALRKWRDRVRRTALDALDAHEYAELGGAGTCARCGVPRVRHAELLGPVHLEAVVTVARPASAPKSRRWPVTRGSQDWDHHGRAISDALTGVVYADDSQVIDGRVVVSYPHVHELALGEPGVTIRVWEVGGDA